MKFYLFTMFSSLWVLLCTHILDLFNCYMYCWVLYTNTAVYVHTSSSSIKELWSSSLRVLLCTHIHFNCTCIKFSVRVHTSSSKVHVLFNSLLLCTTHPLQLYNAHVLFSSLYTSTGMYILFNCTYIVQFSTSTAMYKPPDPVYEGVKAKRRPLF